MDNKISKKVLKQVFISGKSYRQKKTFLQIKLCRSTKKFYSNFILLPFGQKKRRKNSKPKLREGVNKKHLLQTCPKSSDPPPPPYNALPYPLLKFAWEVSAMVACCPGQQKFYLNSRVQTQNQVSPNSTLGSPSSKLGESKLKTR